MYHPPASDAAELKINEKKTHFPSYPLVIFCSLRTFLILFYFFIYSIFFLHTRKAWAGKKRKKGLIMVTSKLVVRSTPRPH